MDPSSVFQLCNTIALIGWLVLVLLPFWFQSDKLIIGVIVTLFCIVYAWLVIVHFNFNDLGKFGTLDGVMELFDKREIVVAGWIHYLAFDLMVGVFIKRNAIKHGIPHWVLVPCFACTFMLGPLGLLLYLIIRPIYSKNYFADNY